MVDVGAGDGWLALTLAKRGSRVIAVDAAPIAVRLLAERARGVRGVVACVATATALPVATGSVDAICLLDVIEHLSVGDAETAIAEARRVLAPGGLLVASVPRATPGLDGRAEGHHHERELDGETLIALLERELDDVRCHGATARLAGLRGSKAYARSRFVRGATNVLLRSLGRLALRTTLLADDPEARFLLATASVPR